MSRKPHGARRHIPDTIKLAVLARQIISANVPAPSRLPKERLAAYIKRLRVALFGDKVNHLHHRPALENRPKDKAGNPIPPANDPGTLEHPHLIYLEAGAPGTAHYVETYVRGIGAQRSDTSQRRYLTKVDKNREPKPKNGKTLSAPIRGLNFQQMACIKRAGCRCDRRRRKRCGNYQPNRKGKR